MGGQSEGDGIVTAEKFIFDIPLYHELVMGDDELYRLFYQSLVFDAYCVSCERPATFSREPIMDLLRKRVDGSIYRTEARCARNPDHKVLVWLRNEAASLTKVGQFPSLADTANDESKRYMKVLDRSDSAELHKAIGLAAHGVGIGSFVYLRRVLERLIFRTFETHQGSQKWEDDHFNRLRTSERITFLKGFLPDFLVDNKRLYSILSRGVHELEEKECLAAFPIMKLAIIEVLEDEQKEREKQERRKKIAEEIGKFGTDL